MIKKMALFTLLLSYAAASDYVLKIEEDWPDAVYKFSEGKLIVRSRIEEETENSRSLRLGEAIYTLPEGFCPQAYMDLNSDVRDKVQQDFPDNPYKQLVAAAFHWIMVGSQETGRQYS